MRIMYLVGHVNPYQRDSRLRVSPECSKVIPVGVQVMIVLVNDTKASRSLGGMLLFADGRRP
jgi:hypothetical protein